MIRQGKIIGIIMLCAVISCFGCTNNKQIDTQLQEDSSNVQEQEKSNGINVDITKLSSTMAYSEVYNMMISPENYEDKIIKVNGLFDVFKDEKTGNIYYMCVILDSTACCSQQIEFVLDGDYSYPDDYPEIGTNITITGKFVTYEEDGDMYYQLADASME